MFYIRVCIYKRLHKRISSDFEPNSKVIMTSHKGIIWLTVIVTVLFSSLYYYFSRIKCIHPHCVEFYAPDTFTKLYSLYLIFLFVFTIIFKIVPKLPYKIRYWLEKDVYTPSYRNRILEFFWPEGSYLEIFVLLAILSLMIVNFIFYWNLMLSVSERPFDAKTYWLAALMGSGHMGDVLVGLTLIPLGRHSFLPGLLNIHIDAALRFHKRCGILLTLVTIAHGFVIWTKTTMLLTPSSYTYWTFNIGVTGPKWKFYESNAGFMATFGFIAGVSIFILWVFTFPTIRRRLYHVFYGIHVLFGPLMVIAGSLHTSSIWYYSMPGIFLLLVDWMIRLKNYWTSVIGIATREACGYVRIDMVNRKHMKLHDGCFVMIKIQELGVQMSHPFTVATDSESDRIILLIKPSSTPSEWSHQLGKLVPYQCIPKEITLRVDGPFGHLRFDSSQMNVVACFVGGVGVAGALAIASGILKSNVGPSSVFIFWAAREVTAGNLTVLQELRNRHDPRLNIHLYGKAATYLFQDTVNDKEQVLDVEVGINLSDESYPQPLAYNIQLEGISGSLERMIPEVLLQEQVMPATNNSGKIGVYTCGPKDLMDSVQRACENVCQSMQIYCHRETFEW